MIAHGLALTDQDPPTGCTVQLELVCVLLECALPTFSTGLSDFYRPLSPPAFQARTDLAPAAVTNSGTNSGSVSDLLRHETQSAKLTTLASN